MAPTANESRIRLPVRPGDRLICAFTSPRLKEEWFKDWPLHITVVPWFRLDKDSASLGQELQMVLSSVPPFYAELGDSAQFGQHKEVSLVKLPSPLLRVEKMVRALLKAKNAWLVDETTRVWREFAPHVTVQRTGRLNKGDSFRIDKLYIVEQLGDQKQIVAVVHLKGE